MSPLTSLSKVAISLAFFVVVTLASATLVRADTVTFDLNKGSTLPNQNYGTITLTLNGSGGIDVSISLLSGNRIVNTGFDASVALHSAGKSVLQVCREPTRWSIQEIPRA
jgi:hypothetical protein